MIISTKIYIIMSNMNIDRIFSNPFHEGKQSVDNQISGWNLKPLQRFPLRRYIVDGDKFYQKVWEMIDSSSGYFWLTTYAMDSSPVADTTLLKMITAAKRGVHVTLFVDNVQLWAKKELIEKLEEAGGKFMVLNPQFRWSSISKYMTKDVWRRHHEKLIVSDNRAIIGSSNIEGHYAGIKYGVSTFRDLNLYSQNIILDQYRKHFTDTANFYKFNLLTGRQNSTTATTTNNKLLANFDKAYPNSQFYQKDKFRLLHNNQILRQTQIEDDICERIKNARDEIKIIQPYHYQMFKFDRLMKEAVSKGIKTEIITSGQRDQLVFRNYLNSMLFSRLMKIGVNVLQTRQRLLHSKVYMFDGKFINLGSMNNDRWSWKINNQLNIIIKDERDYEEVEHYYQNLKQECNKVKQYKGISVSRAASVNFWQWFLYLSEIVMSRSGKPEEDYIEHSTGFEDKTK